MKSTEQTRARAQAVLDFIHANPESHSQENWSVESECGTTMCIAGTALFLEYGAGWQEGVLGGYSEAAGFLLGLEDHPDYRRSEIEAVFYEMDNERAIQKLKKMVVGEQFNDDDFDTELE